MVDSIIFRYNNDQLTRIIRWFNAPVGENETVNKERFLELFKNLYLTNTYYMFCFLMRMTMLITILTTEDNSNNV